MSTEDRIRLEKYIRESLQKAGKSQSDIDEMVDTILSMKFMQSTSAIDAFIKASQ